MSPRKRKKTLHISSSNELDEDNGEKVVEQVFTKGKTYEGKKVWKPKVNNLNVQIIEKDNFVQLNKFYILYANNDRRKLENFVVRNMILKDRRFDNIKDKIPIDLYTRLVNRENRVVEEVKEIRVNMIKRLCVVHK